MKKIHSVQIPVMGTGFSIDTPIKVAKYGISSVISIVDDVLIEDMRKYYSTITSEEYKEITKYEDDYRAKRITAYLNLVDKIVKQNFNEVKDSCFELGSEITKYFEMLSDNSPLKKLYNNMLNTSDAKSKKELQEQLRGEMKPGDINVNIMTKLDRTNYNSKKEPLPDEYSDALCALRGYAKSTLDSAIVFSAGINRRLYTYVEKFEDFYANASGYIKKKIILKVSDYRSSIIQGKFFAKKGLWISEFRIESGLNCGGHAFASDGYLMGPMLEEFKQKRKELIDTLYKAYTTALEAKNKLTFNKPHEVSITAQGGIGTYEEDQYLMKHYELDGTGWATPFLLVPEATNVDDETLTKLLKAKEEDLYLSGISPLGVPFNNIRDNLSDLDKMSRVKKGRPGSACPKGYLVSNTEFTDIPICTASRQYQKLKLEQLEKMNLSNEKFDEQFAEVVDKGCICNDLAESPLIKHKVPKNSKRFTAICPGPNLAYFSKVVTLKEMIDHIYGRISILNDTYRPNMFIKELRMYVEYFINQTKQYESQPTDKQIAYLRLFKNNILDGIEYYKKLFPQMLKSTKDLCDITLSELGALRKQLEDFVAGSNLGLENA